MNHRSRCLIMARRGRKPKSVEAKEFLINNDKDFNSWGGKKGMIYSSAAKFMNIMPTGESHTYMTPVKKGERLGKGKYRIVAHYPNKQSDDRDSYESTRKSKDLVYDNDLTKPSRIKYDGIVGTGDYHLITHDRDGKRVEFILGNWAGFKNTHGDAGFPIFAEMYLPDKERRRSTGKKLMACPVKVGTFIVSNSHPGEMKLEATKPKGECAKFGNSNAKKHQVSPLEYEMAAETEEHFMSEGELLHFYSMNGVSMDAEDLLSNYQAIDSVIVDRSSYQPAQDYGAETSFSADTLDEFCASCGEHKAEGCGGCHAAEEDIVCPSCGSDNWGEQEGYSCRDCDRVFNPYNAESDAATYAPSNDPDMVNSIPTEPTNAEADLFGAESKNKWVKGKNGKFYVLRKKTGHMVTHNAESFNAFSIAQMKGGKIHIENKCDGCGKEFHLTENTNIIGGNRAGAIVYEKLYNSFYNTGHDYPEYSPHGDLLCKSCYKEGAEDDDFQRYNRGQGQYDAESKAMFTKDKRGKMYARKRNGRIITRNAEYDQEVILCRTCGASSIGGEIVQECVCKGAESQGAYPTLEDFNGLESVVVEPPLGHGVAQWYAEGDAATYSPSNEPDMVNEIQTEPTNANFEGENFDEVRTGFNYGIGGYLGFTSIAVGSLMIANLIMERFGKKTGE